MVEARTVRGADIVETTSNCGRAFSATQFPTDKVVTTVNVRTTWSRHSTRMIATAMLLGAVLSPVMGSKPMGRVHAEDTTSHYTGWAMDAYPGDSVDTIKAEMGRQLKAGANVIWLGHNNPGNVAAHKAEPGLSYAVWAASLDPQAPGHDVAVGIVRAERNALDAARSLGAKVVLPVGYQIQMGDVWNQAHPADLRVGADGGPYNAGGRSASFYSPRYRRDITAYYHWVDTTFARPYSSTILMLNLADEPADGDYSVWADRAFSAQHGFGLHQAGANPARQEQVGRFEAAYIADYATWSASQWLGINPAIKVTMSFDGGYSRYKHEGPDLETIFREVPANFVVTFDAYPRDGLYSTPLRTSDLTTLFTLVRTLGHFAAVYNRPLWLWSAANSWGLNGASADPGNIADAVANGIYLAQLVNQGGGALAGLAVWNYNIRGQGLFNDTHHLTYDPNLMFARVSASFAVIRRIMVASPGQPDTVILAPNTSTVRAAGARLAMRAEDIYDWTALAAPARDNVAALLLTHLDGETLPALRTAIVLARTPADLVLADRGALLSLLGHGGTVIATPPVAQALLGSSAQSRVVASSSTRAMTVKRLTTAQGTLLAVDGGAVEQLFTDASLPWAAGIRAQVLHQIVQATGYLVAAGGATLLYSGLAQDGASISLAIPSGATGDLTVYDTYGAVRQTIHLTGRTVQLHLVVARRSYALLPPTGTQ